MIVDVEGIVLNTRDYSDTSKILDILTKEYGIIGVLAKGCKSMKSNLRSYTDKLTFAKFNIFYKKDKLSILSEATIIDGFKNIKSDISMISYANYILDLTNQVYKQNNNNDIYDLLIFSLKKINKKFNPLIITNILELKYLDYLGIMPALDGCIVCGNKNVVTLSSDKGGYVCSKCYTNERMYTDKAIKLARLYYLIDINKISKLDIESSVVLEVNMFLDEYYDRYAGLYLKSKNFLNSINKYLN